ncbi:uncharacterized protein UBRO_20857 [Ustilago bromivora]|uniref:Uncharacterized protein n=1 Tax=Ustilago bromivora TaxID=307758 RepID=A0A1K0HIX3_9BASI|nr:uncharacterized protein UBRO_20857 [Ustilago bromivora]
MFRNCTTVVRRHVFASLSSNARMSFLSHAEVSCAGPRGAGLHLGISSCAMLFALPTLSLRPRPALYFGNVYWLYTYLSFSWFGHTVLPVVCRRPRGTTTRPFASLVAAPGRSPATAL